MNIRITAIRLFALLAIFYLNDGVAQNCTALQSSINTSPSRCLSTGSIAITPTGGSGNYSYKIAGPVNSSFVSSATFNGLPKGVYTVTIKDNSTGCLFVNDKVQIAGGYTDPHFEITKTDETCKNGNNGIVKVSSSADGRAPLIFTIVSPSASFEGRTESDGIFDQLIPGDYSIQMTDSCGAILTHKINVAAFEWEVQSPVVKEKECGIVEIFLPVSDNSGNTNAGASSVFNGFKYGVIYLRDTTWFSNPIFSYSLLKKKALEFIVVDKCGVIESEKWVSDFIPSIAQNVVVNAISCNNFSVAVTGQHVLKNAVYCLYDQQHKLKSCNATGSFTSLTAGSYHIEVKSSCYDTVITRSFLLLRNVPSVDSAVQVVATGCTSYKVSVAGLSDFTSPQFSLYDNRGNLLVSYQNSSLFNVNKSGSYCIRIKDACYDTVVNICFRLQGPIPSVAENMKLLDITCEDATIITDSIKNLAGGVYCLYNSGNTLIACNNTGVFSKIKYGNYTLKITADKNCFDTVIEKSVLLRNVSPVVDAGIAAVRGCTTIQLKLGGQRLTNADFCLYDASGILIQCNKTGVFPDLSYGTWCIKIKNDPLCYDTVISRCITIKKALPAVGNVITSEPQCDGFTASVSGALNLYQPKFILRTATGIFTDSNSTGIFRQIKYGSYCVEVWNDRSCYDTVLKRCFSYARPAPVAGNPVINEEDCFSFSADFSVKQNVYSPVYYLLNDRKDTLATNSSGYFKSLVYGSYCIVLKDRCSGVVFERCFTRNQPYINTIIKAEPGCVINTSTLRVSYLSGKAPFTTKVYDPSQQLLSSVTSSESNSIIINLPEIGKGLMYRVVSTDSCGKTDTRNIQPVVVGLITEKSFQVYCPDAVLKNGSSDLFIKSSPKSGTTSPVIIKINGRDTAIQFSKQLTDTFVFKMLLPATYIVRYKLQSVCAMVVYDTVTVAPYSLPSVKQSVAYTCDNGGISVGASVIGGAAPYLYQVIGSIPETPSILTDLQTNPIFEINNGNQYSLIRLRGIDACGNAALSDVSILPLADISISASGNCLYKPARLESDSILHSINSWYRVKNNTEIFVQEGVQLNIPYLLPADTGVYILKSDINNGCLIKTASFHLNGDCKIDPPVSRLLLQARLHSNLVALTFTAEDEKQVLEYIVERKTETNGNFESIGIVKVKPGQRVNNDYYFEDNKPVMGNNYYRIRVFDQRSNPFFSNTANVKWSQYKYYFYPNPAKDFIYIRVPDQTHNYGLVIYTSSGHRLLEKSFQRPAGGLILLPLKNSARGLLQVSITDQNTGISTAYKILKD